MFSQYKCVYPKCMLNCVSKSHHMAIYASKNENKTQKTYTKKQSAKINYKKWLELFPDEKF
jgi:hypothetical protein